VDIESRRSHSAVGRDQSVSKADRFSPLTYLDLFKLYHDLGRRKDYDELRGEFSRSFNAQLPVFDAFKEQGDGLEVYKDAMGRIESLWNTPQVLDAIEESIFRKPGESSESFGLEAYRELLLLYAIANEFVDPQADDAAAIAALGDEPTARLAGDAGQALPVARPTVRVPEVFLPTSPQPIAGVFAGRGGNYVPLRSSIANNVPGRQGVGLDIDLSNPTLGRRADGQNIPPAGGRQAYGGNSNAGSAWLEFDLGELSDDVRAEEPVRKPPVR
jgi:hypothetical protein